jgi:1-deoxy-D-xylulose-5-phosphate reductoisomerase
MVDFVDGTTKAVLGYPDMRVPISITLGYPERLFRHPKTLRLDEVKKLEFDAPDPKRYPAIRLGFEAGKKGKTYPAVLNAANEVAVQLFLDGRLPFDQIVPMVAEAMKAHKPAKADSVEALLEADAWARNTVGAAAV